jgi:flagellar basal-body rod modification protein FlgD
MSLTPVQNNQIMENYFTMPSKRNTGNLGKDDFLNLLVTQLKYQDPLKPMEDKEFIAQMAQFSSLEQMQNMNTTFSSVKAFSMIGKEISATVKDEESGELKVITGVAESVRLVKGKTYVVVDGKDILVDDITDVFDAPSVQPDRLTDFTGMIGQKVTGVFVDAETLKAMDITGDVASLKLINGTVYSVINNANVVIDDVMLNEDEQASFTDLETYLTEKMEKGEEITAVLVRKDAGGDIETKVTVKGFLKSFEANEEGEIVSAVMDGIRIPANNIHTIGN